MNGWGLSRVLRAGDVLWLWLRVVCACARRRRVAPQLCARVSSEAVLLAVDESHATRSKPEEATFGVLVLAPRLLRQRLPIAGRRTPGMLVCYRPLAC